MSNNITQYHGDCREVLKTIPDKSVHCCVTSPPYFGLRDYGVDGQIGLEPTPEEFVAELVKVFREVRRVLRDDGTLWLNLGDSYARAQETNVPQTKNKPVEYPEHNKVGSSDGFTGRGDRPGSRAGRLPPKNLIGIPWRVAFALQDDGWYLRQDIIWHKPNPMPESVTDRCTKAHEYIFLLSKSARYFYDHEKIKEPVVCGDHERNVDTIYSAPGQPQHCGLRKKSLRGPGNKSHKGTTAYESGDEMHRTKAGLVEYAEKCRDSAAELRNKRSVWDQEEYSSVIEWLYENHPSVFLEIFSNDKKDTWTVPTQPYSAAHFATFPEKLIEPCILAGCPEGGTVLDCFGGSGTTARVAIKNRRKAILIELNHEYVGLQNNRTSKVQLNLI